VFEVKRNRLLWFLLTPLILVFTLFPVPTHGAPATPEVEIVYPMEGDEFSGDSVSVNISYSIEKGTVHTVKLQVDGSDYDSQAVHQKAGVVTISLDLTKLSAGEHKLQAIAYLGAQPAQHDGKSVDVRIKVIKEEVIEEEPETEDEDVVEDDQAEEEEVVVEDDQQEEETEEIEGDEEPEDSEVVQDETDQEEETVIDEEQETDGEIVEEDLQTEQDEIDQDDETKEEEIVQDDETQQEQEETVVEEDAQQQDETEEQVAEETTGQEDEIAQEEETDTGEIAQEEEPEPEEPAWDDDDKITIPTKPPYLKVTSPKTGLLTRSSTITVEGKTGTDAEVLILGEDAAVKSDGSFSIKIDLEEGLNVLPIQAIGKNGLVTSEILNVTLDQTPPRLSLVSDDFQTINVIPTIMILVEEENGLNEKSLQSSLSRTGARRSASLSGNMIVINPPADTKDGLYDVSATISDAAGNSATLDGVSFVLDRKNPEIASLSLKDGDEIPVDEAENGFKVSGKITDPAGGAGIDKDETYISINGDDTNAKIDELTGDFSFTLADAAPGVKVLVIESQDKAGNIMPPHTLTFSVGSEDTETVVEAVMEELSGEEEQAKTERKVKKVIFTSSDDGDYEIYSLDLAGEQVARLTDTPGYNVMPSYSAAAQKIAFSSTRDGNSEIYIMNEDGTGQTRLTDNDKYDAAPVFSPDGRSIAFVSDRDGGYGIYLLDLQTKETNKIAGEQGIAELPAFSPDGKTIAYASNADGDFNIYIKDLETGEETNLTEGREELDSYPAFSSDGSAVYYISNRESGSDIYQIELESGGTKRITTDGRRKSNMAVGDSELVFSAKDGGGYKISRIDLSNNAGEILASNYQGLYPVFLER